MTIRDNESHCNTCHLDFDTITEVGYFSPDDPCCPRCRSRDLVKFRMDGKIVERGPFE